MCAMSWPSIRMRPRSTSWKRCSSASTVDLPPPDGPTSPVRWPGRDAQAEILEARGGRRDRRTRHPRRRRPCAAATSGTALGCSRSSCGCNRVAIASARRAMCCVTSTRATARSRVACSTVKPSVQTSTTSPRARPSALPQHDGPGEHRHGQHDGERPHAAGAVSRDRAGSCGAPASRGRRSGRSGCARGRWRRRSRTSGMLPITSPSRPRPRRPVGEIVMQGRAGRGQPEQSSMISAAIAVRAAAIGTLTTARKAMAPTVATQGGSTFQMNMIFDGEGRVRGRGDAAGQRSRQAIREIARRMAGEMAEEFAPQIAGHADEGMACDPAGQPPQQIVGGDQRDQQGEGEPDAVRVRSAPTSVSTRNFTPYCVLTEQPTAPSTASESRHARCGRRRT